MGRPMGNLWGGPKILWGDLWGIYGESMGNLWGDLWGDLWGGPKILWGIYGEIPKFYGEIPKFYGETYGETYGEIVNANKMLFKIKLISSLLATMQFPAVSSYWLLLACQALVKIITLFIFCEELPLFFLDFFDNDSAGSFVTNLIFAFKLTCYRATGRASSTFN